MAFLDDITYTPLYGTTTPVTLLGYNVYRDDEKIAEKIAATSFNDNAAAEGNHTYYVTAVWKEGESNTSDTYEASIATGIASANAHDGMKIATSKGLITVSGAAGQNVVVANLAGQTLFHGIASDNTSVSVTTGAYLVKVGGKAVKVIVK